MPRWPREMSTFGGVSTWLFTIIIVGQCRLTQPLVTAPGSEEGKEQGTAHGYWVCAHLDILFDLMVRSQRLFRRKNGRATHNIE